MKVESIKFQSAEKLIRGAVIPQLGTRVSTLQARVPSTDNWIDVFDPGDADQTRPAHFLSGPPNVNRAKNGKINWLGRQYTLGENHALHFELSSRSSKLIDSSESSVITEFIASRDVPDRKWPVDYRVQVERYASGSMFGTKVEVTNLGNLPMPVSLADHPMIPRTLGKALLYAPARYYFPMEDCIPTGERKSIEPESIYDYSNFCAVAEGLDDALAGCVGPVIISFPERRLTAVIEDLEGNARFLQIWNDPNRSVWAVERQTSIADSVNLSSQGIGDLGLQVLNPGQKWQTHIRWSFAFH